MMVAALAGQAVVLMQLQRAAGDKTAPSLPEDASGAFLSAGGLVGLLSDDPALLAAIGTLAAARVAKRTAAAAAAPDATDNKAGDCDHASAGGSAMVVDDSAPVVGAAATTAVA